MVRGSQDREGGLGFGGILIFICLKRIYVMAANELVSRGRIIFGIIQAGSM